MLKLLFKITLVVLILFGVSQYSNYLMTGKAPEIPATTANLPDINISKLKDSISNKFKSIKKEKTVEEIYLYKWRDTKGVIHYASEKPLEEIENLETIKLNSNTNVVPAISDNKEKKDAPRQKPVSTELPKNVYSPEGIKHLFDQAKGIQGRMNEQFTQQENIINRN